MGRMPTGQDTTRTTSRRARVLRLDAIAERAHHHKSLQRDQRTADHSSGRAAALSSGPVERHPDLPGGPTRSLNLNSVSIVRARLLVRP